ncbi:Di-and tricarboxylate transporter [Halopenitus malekzadehii]|uniref:Di-and tricarboxylate transporter n=2 Tax=Halopenitus malekzadehii TaxID=1267564 RepID=A0A1H6I8J6_9EURY|nr:Di-and tricarboxylate transporter [Halopenitus malekzadehii]
MLSITVFCIGLWVLAPIRPGYTSVIGIGLLAAVFSPEMALSGFSSSATWLVGFGLLMGVATRRSGLAGLASDRVIARCVPASVRSGDGTMAPTRIYRRLLIGLGLSAHALALLVPSALVRVLLLAPILSAIGSRFDDRTARVGLYLGPLFATFYGSPGFLTADLPNIIISGLAASLADHTIAWSEWAVHLYPVMGITRVIAVIAVVYVLFRPDADSTVTFAGADADVENVGSEDVDVEDVDVEDVDAEDVGAGTAVDPEGTDDADGPSRPGRMLAFLLVGTAIWMTDFIHGLDPVVGALAVVVLAFLPGIGVVSFEIVDAEADFTILFFVAVVLSIGDGLASTGVSETAATALLGSIPADVPLAVSLTLVYLSTAVLALLMEGLAVASVLTPVLIQFAEASGLPLTPVLLSETLALSTYFFPYQSAVLIAMLAEGDVETGELIRTTAACSLVTMVVLFPLQLLWFGVLY